MPASAEGGTDAAVRGPVRVERVSLPDLSPAPPAPFEEQELTLLAGLDYREQDALAASTRLRAAGLDADRAAAVLTQAKLRGEAAAKFGPEAEHLLLTRPGLEQATRRAVAEHHAARLRAAGLGSVADLGCGLGADTLAFARAGLCVLAVEIDPHTAACAAANLRSFPDARVLVGDVEQLEPGQLRCPDGGAPTALWLDPARRESGAGRTHQRIFDPEAFSPPFSVIRRLAATGVPMGVKMGPGMDRAAIPPEATAEWVSHGGDVVEVVLWFNALATPGVRRRATVLGPDPLVPRALHVLDSPVAAEQEPAAPVGPPGAYLYEPDGAVIRSGQVRALAEAVDGRLLDARIAYVTSDDARELDWARCWRIATRLPLHEKTLRRWVREHGVTSLTVKKRGVDVVPERLRRRLLAGASRRSGAGGKHATLLATRWDGPDGEQRACFVVEPL